MPAHLRTTARHRAPGLARTSIADAGASARAAAAIREIWLSDPSSIRIG